MPLNVANGQFDLVEQFATADLYGDLLGYFKAPSALPHYVDNGDGTVTDNTTGLMWEKKLASNDAGCSGLQPSRSPRCVLNYYNWSLVSSSPDGSLYTDFLAKLNLNASGDGVAACFANHCDWRVPLISELRSILSSGCPSSPCIDPIFGPTQIAFHWSSSSAASDPSLVWSVSFFNGAVSGTMPKTNQNSARAVRGGR
jgi:hypothetical protein